MNTAFPADGFGIQSPYYDENLLFDGTYEIISVTLHADSRDTGNSPTTTLRKGLLLAKRAIDGKYEPLSTEDGYLNGLLPSHFMKDVVVLANEYKITTVQIKGIDKYLPQAQDLIVPAYWTCNLRYGRYYYNNSSAVALTSEQLKLLRMRISIIPSTVKKFKEDYGELRVLPGVQNIKKTTL